YLRQPECPRCGDGGAAARVRECAAGGQGGGHCERARYRIRTNEFAGCRCSDARERAGFQGGDCGSRGRASGRGGEPAGRRQEDSASAARAFCETAAGVGSASRTTSGEKRSTDAASGRLCGGAADGEGSACGESGDTECGTSGQPAECRAARPT